MRLIDADELKEIIGECPENWTNSPEEVEAFNMWHRIMDDIDSTPTIGGWISVDERLPEPPAQCLVYSSEARRPRGMETATYTKLGWMTATYFPEITHWMLLPEPPRT
jgi:hypothetical protein